MTTHRNRSKEVPRAVDWPRAATVLATALGLLALASATVRA